MNCHNGCQWKYWVNISYRFVFSFLWKKKIKTSEMDKNIKIFIAIWYDDALLVASIVGVYEAKIFLRKDRQIFFLLQLLLQKRSARFSKLDVFWFINEHTQKKNNKKWWNIKKYENVYQYYWWIVLACGLITFNWMNFMVVFV